MKSGNHSNIRFGIQGLFAFIVLVAFASTLFLVPKAHAAVDEEEPNSSIATANAIKVGTTVYGTRGAKDSDYFKIVAPLSGTLIITFQPTASQQQDLRCHIYDEYGNRLVDGGWTGNRTTTPVTFTYGISYGKSYYIWMGSYYQSAVIPYKFSTAYEIQPTTITSTSKAKRAFTVKWQKKSTASFYQVKFTKKSTYDDYGWSKGKTVKISKGKSSHKATGLKSKTKYLVKVRVARTIDGKTYYSAWSSRKSVTTK